MHENSNIFCESIINYTLEIQDSTRVITNFLAHKYKHWEKTTHKIVPNLQEAKFKLTPLLISSPYLSQFCKEYGKKFQLEIPNTRVKFKVKRNILE